MSWLASLDSEFLNRQRLIFLMGLQPIDLIGPELASGEQVAWLGTPSMRATLLAAAVPVLFGAIFVVGALQSSARATSERDNVRTSITTLIGIVIGLIVAYPGVINVCAIGRVAYAVTDRRILIVTWRFGKRVLSIEPRRINTLEHKLRANGTGSVFFRIDNVNTPDGPVVERSGFQGISDVPGAILALNRLRSQFQG